MIDVKRARYCQWFGHAPSRSAREDGSRWCVRCGADIEDKNQ